LALEFKNIKNYHLDKTIECNRQNIDLFHIFEDEWNNKQDIIKSIIRNKLRLIYKKIYTEKCIIKNIRNFFIHGYIKTKYNIGLYFNNELVSLLCIEHKNNYELKRFYNIINIDILNSFSKLFNYFILKKTK